MMATTTNSSIKVKPFFSANGMFCLARALFRASTFDGIGGFAVAGTAEVVIAYIKTALAES